ncbi:MAG: twin-arginine translocation signal domain-containing protein [Chloroflexi bacterium]|nr:MAG: twin-arginine translocation signal domain-containing protein [Chloroflexota bacterium]TME16545.1 MAG: twin-arginine translocation signal domain-containing protein [Chloroflexota bacterium]TME20664.1 MAG: twin-arginine translocation signal domain-containing protein [Chloroflexota bacterium]
MSRSSAVNGINRRDFLKVGAATAGAVAASGLGFDLARANTIKQNLKIAGSQELHSICPYCAVGCSLVAYTRRNADGSTRLLQIEGDPSSPVNEGRLCPKGATAMQLAVSRRRIEKPLYRAPGSNSWVEKDWNFMLDKIAQNFKASRDRTFVAQDVAGNTVNRTEGIAFAGGAAFSSEEGYFATKVMRTLGLVHLEQQARV